MNTMQAKSILVGFAITLSGLASTLSAHPGHGALRLPSESTAHYTFEPMHMLPALGAGLILVLAIRWIGRCRWRQRAAQK